MRARKSPSKLSRKAARKMGHYLVSYFIRELRMKGNAQQLVEVSDDDLPVLLNVLIGMERRLIKKTFGGFTPWTQTGQEWTDRVCAATQHDLKSTRNGMIRDLVDRQAKREARQALRDAA